MSTYEIRSKPQYEILVGISIMEKTRYLVTAAQQLSYDVLHCLLPIFENNLCLLETITIENINGANIFEMDFNFCMKTCIAAHKKLIRVVKSCHDDKSLYEKICLENKNSNLAELCNCLDSLWHNYWNTFHINKDNHLFLKEIEERLIELYGAICIKGNEQFPENFKCLSCIKDAAYLKTGILSNCDNNKTLDKKYCHHFVDVDEKCSKPNINRIIFERRMNELDTRQNS